MAFDIHVIGPKGSRHYRFYSKETKRYRSPALTQNQVTPYYLYLMTRDYLTRLKNIAANPLIFEAQLAQSEILLQWLEETPEPEVSPEEAQALLEQFNVDTQDYSQFLQKIGRLFPSFTNEESLPTCLQITGEGKSNTD